LIEVKKGPVRDEWLELPYSEHVLKVAKENRKRALERLIQAAHDSTDARVGAAHARYMASRELVELFTRQEIGKDDDHG
jgi:hypothetical protein